ncbi:MAG TPA: 3,4-dihydroxy-2-butanone-4-phosphate synthase [Patescibacteria group bacterium]|nr:3,4-dihydroxy-2-butanone-4-phosphate synthase [Patescibacteria group bacterium]
MTRLSTIPQALAQVKRGRLIIVVDNPRRENEGDFYLPAELITPRQVAFMVTHGRGLLCVPLTQGRARQLRLPLMVPRHKNTETTGISFTVSVNANNGGSGISAHDRARTISLLADPKTRPGQLTRPGHVFPLIAHPKGLAVRDGHTEAAVALAQAAGFAPVGVLCEILRDDGRMARLPDLLKLARKYGLAVISISDLKKYLKSAKPQR